MANVFSKNSWVSTDPSAAKQRERLNKEGKLFDNLVMATLNVFILKIDGSIIGSSLQKTCLGGESVLFTAEEISILVPPEMTIKEEIVDTVVEGCETRNLILTQIIPGPGEIWYTSTDGNIIQTDQYAQEYCGVIENVKEGDHCVLRFDPTSTYYYTVDSLLTGSIFSYSEVDKVVSLRIGEGYTTVGSYWAYGTYNNLEEIIFPDTIKEFQQGMGGGASLSAPKLSRIRFPKNIESMTVLLGVTGSNQLPTYEGVIYSSDDLDDNIAVLGITNVTTEATEITIKEGTKYITDNFIYDEWAGLAKAPNLQTLNLPNSIQAIGSNSFCGCSNLTTVNFDADNLTYLGYYVFSNCPSLEVVDNLVYADTLLVSASSQTSTYNIKNTTKFIATEVFQYNASLTSLVIPESVIRIGEYAFTNCSSLTQITLPNGLTVVNKGLFNGCTSLVNITLGNHIKEIGSDAFCNTAITSFKLPRSVIKLGGNIVNRTPQLTSITVDPLNPVFTDKGINIIYEISTDTLISACKNSTIPDSTKVIGASAFSYCTELTSVNIPESVKSIGSSAFYSCSGLTSIIIPDSVESIDQRAFYYCSGLTEISLPSKLSELSSSIFQYCSSLSQVRIPSNIINIGSMAFYGCSNLETVIIDSAVPATISFSVFDNNKSGRKIYVPEGSVDAYKAASNWNTYSNFIVSRYVPDTYKSLTISAMSVPAQATNTIINYEYLTDGHDMISGEIHDVKISGSEASGSFPQNTSETESVERTVTYSGHGLSASTNIVQKSLNAIPDNSEIWYMTTNSTVLTNFNTPSKFGSGLTTLMNTYLGGIAVAKYSGDITKLNASEFRNNTTISFIKIPASVTSIGNYALQSCTNLLSAEIYANITKLPNGIFNGCTKLTKLVLSQSITEFDDNALFSCSSLVNFELPTNLVKLGNSALAMCSALSSLHIGKSLTNIDSNGIYGLSGATSITVDSENTVYDSRGNCNAIIVSASNTLLIGCKTTVIPDSVVALSNRSFYKNTGITEMTIPSSITNITSESFYGTGLTSIVIPSTVTTISESAFDSCKSLTSVTLNTGLTSIGNYAFNGCTALANINLPEGLISIGSYAFYGCKLLVNIVIPASVTSIRDRVFCSISFSTLTDLATTPPSVDYSFIDTILGVDTRHIYVPTESVNTYKSATNWNRFSNIISAIPTV